MSHTATLGDVEVPVTFTRDTAVGLLQAEGLVGAGGAGFPTYVKYERPPHTLIVNAAESEPGYYANKLLLRDEPEAYVDVFHWVRRTFSIDRIIVGAEAVAKPYLRELEQLEDRVDLFEIRYFESKYKYGQERALCKVILGVEIGPNEIPPDHGIVVNNNETIFNMYKAAFREEPVTTKFLQVYGEARPIRVYEAPIGTLACDLLRFHGTEPADMAHCRLYDGGPVLAEKVGDPMGPEPMHPVQKTTNGILVVDPEKDRPRNKHYPEPGFEKNSADAPFAPDKIVDLMGRVRRVRVPLRGRFWSHGPMRVREGDQVRRGDVLAEPAIVGRSVGVHASIDGDVTQITTDHVQIER